MDAAAGKPAPADNFTAATTVAADDRAGFATASPSLAPGRGGWALATVIALTFFAATAPTLAWLEFSSGMENLVAATALEIRRTGAWLIPTLEGEARTAKPPLAAWISAVAVRQPTLAKLDDADPLVRDAAYRRLAWEIRWPGLLSSCAMLLAVFALGRSVGGDRIGLVAMLVAGSTLYFLRFGRQATTDVQLALWVAVANAAIARLLLQGVTWPASLVAGAALGLALMSKGPVALLQSIVPAAIFVIVSHRRVVRRRWAPIVAGLVLMLIVGGAWYAFVAATVRTPQSVWSRWTLELARAGPQERPGYLFSYATIFAYLLPWTPVFIFGAIWTGVEAWRDRRQGAQSRGGWLLALLLVVIPIVAMSFFPDRKERYLLPLLAPAAVLAARGLQPILRDTPGPRVPASVQWAIILILGVGFPIAAGTRYVTRADGSPWHPLNFAIAIAVAMLAMVVGAIAFARTTRFALVAATVGVMLVLQPLFFIGYRATRQGRSEMRPLAELIRASVPDAQMHHWRPRGPQRLPVDLSIYLNRPTPWVGDAAALPPNGRPQVIATMQPEPPGPDWIPLGRVPRDRDFYYAYCRRPAAPASAAAPAPAAPAPAPVPAPVSAVP